MPCARRSTSSPCATSRRSPPLPCTAARRAPRAGAGLGCGLSWRRVCGWNAPARALLRAALTSPESPTSDRICCRTGSLAMRAAVRRWCPPARPGAPESAVGTLARVASARLVPRRVFCLGGSMPRSSRSGRPPCHCAGPRVLGWSMPERRGFPADVPRSARSASSARSARGSSFHVPRVSSRVASPGRPLPVLFRFQGKTEGIRGKGEEVQTTSPASLFLVRAGLSVALGLLPYEPPR